MLTIDILKDYGANVDEGLSRCLGKEDFYLKLVKMALEDGSFDRLQKAVAEGNLTDAFEAAHSLKGVLGNLALTPIYNPTVEITELLRAGTEMDYDPLVQTILAEREKLIALNN